jgi:transcriptional regulator with XRE-family HTH domain
MPERSFGRTVKYRRTKLGLSQAKLGDLVGRSPATVRSWERDESSPSDPAVLTALAAILGVDERHLYGKAGQQAPEIETSPTIEQALATLSPEAVRMERGETPGLDADADVGLVDPSSILASLSESASVAIGESGSFEELSLFEDPIEVPETKLEPETPSTPDRQPTKPAHEAPPSPLVATRITPPTNEASYMEDSSQRQIYRVRSLATIVALVALVILFLWALGEGTGALGDWWDQFFGNLRL